MEWAARAIGVFYVLGGLMLLYQAWLNWRLQRALAGLVAIPVAEHVGDGVIVLAGVLVMLSGATLAALSGWAVDGAGPVFALDRSGVAYGRT